MKVVSFKMRAFLLGLAAIAAVWLGVACGSGDDGGDNGGAAGSSGAGASAGSGANAGVGASGGGGQAGSGNGESCPQAVDITAKVSAGQSYQGSATAVATVAGSCSAQTASTSWLKFHVEEPGQYSVKVTLPESAAKPDAALIVTTGCDASAFELDCNPKAAYLDTYFSVPTATDVYLALSGDAYGAGYTVFVEQLSPCSSDYECADFGIGLVCDSDMGTCVVCKTDADCGVGHCDPSWKYCATCTPASCASQPTNRFCNPSTLECGCEMDSDCASGTFCVVGECGPPPAEVVVSSTEAQCLTVNDTHVFYALEFAQELWSKPLSGGSATLLASGIELAAFAIDSSYVYWVGKSGTKYVAQKAPLAGGKIVTLAMGSTPLGGQYSCSPAAVDGSYLYTQLGSQGIAKIPLGGGAPITLTSELAYHFGITPEHVYFDAGYVQRISKSGGTPEGNWSGAGSEIVGDANYVHWINNSATGGVELTRISVAQGLYATAEPIGDLAAHPNANARLLTQDAASVYLALLDDSDSTTHFYGVDKGSGTTKKIGVVPTYGVYALAVNGSHLYFADGTISRFAK